MAQVLASLYAVISEQLFLEYGVYENTAALFCRARRPVAKIIERQLAAEYPELEERIHESAMVPQPGTLINTAELRLVSDVMPILPRYRRPQRPTLRHSHQAIDLLTVGVVTDARGSDFGLYPPEPLTDCS